MKTLITIVSLFVFTILTYGQDGLWLELESSVSRSVSAPNNVIINGVYAPEIDCKNEADKDLFVIYDDGTHYNSRGVEPRPFRNNWLYRTYGSSAGQLGIIVPDGNRIRFLYLTNLYEGDDPPPPPPNDQRIVRGEVVEVGHESLAMEVTSEVQNSGFYANHSVRPGYDITLIIDSMIDQSNLSIQIKSERSPIFEDANIHWYFSKSEFPEIGENYIGLDTAYVRPESYTLINGKNGFCYFNLGAKNTLNIDKVDSIRFFIDERPLTESVNNVFDPNYIELQSICGPYYRYKVAIRNNGRAIAQDVALIVTLPFKFKSVEVNSIDMGDYQFPSVRSDPIDVVRFDGREPHFSHNKRTINFLFENAKLSNCKTVKGKQLADGYIIFTVKKSPDDELTRVDEVKPTFAQSTMWAYHSGDGESFTIDKFKVATKIGKNDDEDKILNVGCKKPIGTKVIFVKECSFLNRFFKNCK